MITCGIDPARVSLAVSFVEDTKQFHYEVYENSYEGYNKFLKKLKSLHREPKICIEGHGDQDAKLALFLKEHSFTKLYQIDPYKSRKLKAAFTENKTDQIDAYIAALSLFFYDSPDKIIVNPDIDGLRNLTRNYVKFQKILVKLKNRLHAALNQNFGLSYKKIFPNLNNTSLHFFKNFPSLILIDKASIKKIHKVLKLGNSNKFKGEYGKIKAQEIKKYVKSLNFTKENRFDKYNNIVIENIAEAIIKINKVKEGMAQKIVEFVKDNFPYLKEYFKDLKGISELTLARLIAEIKDINNFKNDGKLAKYAGCAPVIYQSSSIKKFRKAKRYNRNLAFIIHMIACTNIRKNGIYYKNTTKIKISIKATWRH